MMRSLGIVSADADLGAAGAYRGMLNRSGHELLAVTDNGLELVRLCALHRPGLIITSVSLAEMDGIEATAAIYRKEPVPVIVVAAADEDAGRLAEAEHVLACLTRPVKESDLGLATTLAVRCFQKMQALRDEAAGLRQALEERKVIERAKGILMKKRGCGEEEAFLKLQKLARNQNRRLVEMAQIIIVAESTLKSIHG